MIRGGDTWKKARIGEALDRVKRQEPGLVTNDLKGGNDENLEPDLRLKVAGGKKGPPRLANRLFGTIWSLSGSRQCDIMKSL